MATQTELAQALADLGDQADKAKTEILAAVKKLQEAIKSAGNTTAEVDAALTNLRGKVQGLDDLNPDA